MTISLADHLTAVRAALADHYTVEHEIGRGGMATVYLAEDRKHHRKVAVKVLRPELGATLGAERFLREIEVAAGLSHPHVLPLHDSGEAEGLLYYVMPYVDGESLRARLAREKQLPIADALEIARDVAGALDHAHRHGVVHRDVKPENVLLSDGRAVVADFGIARAINAAGGGRLTTAGFVLGTPAYMSPEQASGDAVDARSDVYALGCVLYEMLAGEPPFTGPTVESLIYKHLTAPAPTVSGMRATVSAEVTAAVARALMKAPADRFQTAGQLAEALRPPSEGQAARRPMSMGTRRRLALAALGLAAVVATGAAAWLGGTRVPAASPAAVPAASSAPPRTPAQRAYVVVAAADGTADPADRAAAHSLVVTALSQSDVVTPLSDAQLLVGLASAGKPGALPVDAATARELAIRGGLRVVVAPTVDRVGGTYHVAVRVLSADSGTAVAAERAIARSADELIPAIDAVVAAVRRRLGERPDAVAASRRLDWAVTPSLAALRHYDRAYELGEKRGDPKGAMAEVRKALAVDPDFADAWSSLAMMFRNAGHADSARWAMAEALKRPHRLTEQRRLIITALSAILQGDIPAAVEASEQAYRLYGDSPNNYAWALVLLDRTAEAVAVMEAWERGSPFGLDRAERYAYGQWLANLGRFAEARRYASDLGPSYLARVAGKQGAWLEAESLAVSVLDTLSAQSPHRRGHLEMVASAVAAQGRVGEALPMLRELRDSLRAWGSAGDARVTNQYLLALSLASGVPLSAADARALAADTTAQGRALAAAARVVLGDTGAAVRALRALPPAANHAAPATHERAVLAATLARARGDAEAVIRALEPLVLDASGRRRPRVAGGRQLVCWLLADAYERRGQLDSAAVWFDELTDVARIGARDRYNDSFGLTHSFAHWRLARLHAARGDRARARAHAATFLAAMRRPDAELAAMVAEARRYGNAR